MSKLNQTNHTATAESVTDDIDLDALEAELAGIDNTDETVDEPNDAKMEDVVSELELEEAKAEVYAEQKSEEVEVSAEDKPNKDSEKSEKKARKPRKSMAGSKKSDVIRDRLGENLSETLVLEVSDATLDAEALAKQQEAILDGIDHMAKKVGEKAVNLIAFINGNAKLSTYTNVAFKFMCQNEEGITATQLIDHFQDQDANGVKSYSVGTARSQGHQMFKLLPELKVTVMDGKKMTINPESLVAAKLKDMVCTE